MKHLFVFLLVICIFICLGFVTNEIVQFSISEFVHQSKFHFVKNDFLMKFPIRLPLHLSYFDVNYKVAHIPESMQLGEWCTHIIDEVFNTCKQKYPIVKSIHYFEQLTNAFCTIYHDVHKSNHAVVIVPLVFDQKCNIDNLSFINSICIISHPKEFKINIKAFLLVQTQKCKAWDL